MNLVLQRSVSLYNNIKAPAAIRSNPHIVRTLPPAVQLLFKTDRAGRAAGKSRSNIQRPFTRLPGVREATMTPAFNPIRTVELPQAIHLNSIKLATI